MVDSGIWNLQGKTVEIEHCLKKANNILTINALNECTFVNFRF